MSTEVRFRGGTTEEHKNFIGADREITVDITKKTLVVHDGSKKGGYPLLSEEIYKNNKATYDDVNNNNKDKWVDSLLLKKVLQSKLDKDAKAVDSDKLGGLDSDAFVKTTNKATQDDIINAIPDRWVDAKTLNNNIFKMVHAVDKIDDLQSVDVDLIKIVYVMDKHRGGVFVYDANKVNINDGGIVFNGWVRQYDGAINVKWFGAKGDAVADDTLSIKKALLAAKGGTLYVPRGIYKITESITIPEYTKVKADKSPTLGVFPQLDDSKIYLRRGYKDKMPGSSFLFVGDGTNWETHITNRSDKFSSFTYLVLFEGKTQVQMENIAIILDVDVLDSNGKLTSPENDNSSVADVGVAMIDNSKCTLTSVNIFGYFNKAGLVISSEGNGSNPDYNSFFNCSFMGDYGAAILGDDVDNSYGLSGTQFYECNFFENDHHSRPADTVDGTNCGSGVIFIDGKTSSTNTNINGHYFYGGCFRTYSNRLLRLGSASNVSFFGVTFEFPGNPANKKMYATKETSSVSFISCRGMNPAYIHHSEFDKVINDLNIYNDSAFHGLNVINKGLWTRVISSLGRGKLQFTTNPLVSTKGWSIEHKDGEYLQVKKDNKIVQEFIDDGGTKFLRTDYTVETIVNNSIVISSSFTKVSGTDDLYTINVLGKDTPPIGFRVVLKQNTTSDSFRIPASTKGNIRVKNDIAFNGLFDTAEFIFDGFAWVLVG